MNLNFVFCGLFLTVVLLSILYKYLLGPLVHRNVPFDQLLKFIDALLRRGRDGAFLIIKENDSKRFIQFSKYIKVKGDFGIELSFPRTDWSLPYYEDFQNYLKRQNIPFVIQKTNTSPTSEFTDVDCGQDTTRAISLIEGVFREVFKQGSSPAYEIEGRGISARDILIDV